MIGSWSSKFLLNFFLSSTTPLSLSNSWFWSFNSCSGGINRSPRSTCKLNLSMTKSHFRNFEILERRLFPAKEYHSIEVLIDIEFLKLQLLSFRHATRKRCNYISDTYKHRSNMSSSQINVYASSQSHLH